MAIDRLEELRRGDVAGGRSNSVRIPMTTNVRNTPDGLIQARATPARIDDSMGQAMQNAGRALASYADYEAQKEKYQQELDANKVYSQSLIDLDGWYENMRTSMKPGGDGFSGEVLKGVDEHIAAAKKDRQGSQFWNQEYDKRMERVRVSMFERAKREEVAEGMRFETEQIDNARTQSQKMVFDGKVTFEEEKERLIGLVNNNPRMTPAAKEKLTESIKYSLAWSDAMRRAKEDPYSYLGKAQPGAAGGGDAANSDSVWSRMIKQESGGKQFGKDGKPLTSSAGAIGIAQVMPGTAPEAAKLAGLPYDEQRYKNDPAYNEAIGRAYFNKQVETFGGDMAKAAAAYNAGPGAVQKAVAKHGENWLAAMPAETKKYVENTVGNPSPIKGGVQVAGPAQAVNRGASWEALTWEQQQRALNAAESRIREIEQEAARQRSTWATDMRYEMENLNAKTSQMVADTAPMRSEQEFMMAYADNPEQGRRAYAEYAEAKLTNQAVASYKGATNAELMAVMAEPPPPKDDPDYAKSVQGQAVRKKAAEQIIEKRKEDPWKNAAQNGDFRVTPLTADRPLGEQLRQRYAAIPAMQSQYGINPQSLLTADETKMLSQKLEASDVTTKMRVLSDLSNGIQDVNMYLKVLQSIAPDSPVTATAGAIAVQKPGQMIRVGDAQMTGAQIAQTILAGEELLNPSKQSKREDGKGKAFMMPKEEDMFNAFRSKVGNAYAGFPALEQHAYQTYKAYYAGRASQTQGMGDPKAMSSSVVNEAIDAATGGIIEWDASGFRNSRKLPMPYGMPKDQFHDAVKQEWDRVKGDKFKRTEYDDIQLRPLGKGDGMYVVVMGTEDQVGTDGKPLILNLKNYKPAANAPSGSSGSWSFGPQNSFLTRERTDKAAESVNRAYRGE